MFTQNRKLNIVCTTILVSLLAIYGIVYFLSRMYLQSSNLRDLIIDQAQQRINRKVNLDDDLVFSIDWNMSPHVIVNNLEIANMEGSKQPNMLTADKVSLNFSLIALLFSEFKVISLEFDNPVLHLESIGKQTNWDFIKNDPDPNRKIKVSIRKVVIKGGSVSLQRDDQPVKKLSIQKLNLHGNSEKLEFVVQLDGKYNSLPLETTFSVDLNEDSASLNVDRFVSNNTELTANAVIEYHPIKIEGALQSNRLDLTGLIHGASVNPNPSGQYSLPDTPIPINDLKGGDVEFKIDVKELILDKLSIKNFHLKVSDQKDVINFTLHPAAEVANGTVSLNITYDLNPSVPSLMFKFKTNGLKLDELLEAAGNRSPISGSDFSLIVNLVSTGSNLSSLVSNADGQILAQIGPGNFLNTTGFSNPFSNILSSVITFNKQSSTTNFTCGVMNLQVNNGVGGGDNNIGLEAASVNVLGSGMVDLRNGTIKFTITPKNLISNFDITQFNMAQMIQVNGTISNPQISLNPISVGSAVASVAKIATMAAGLPGIAAIAGAELNNSNTNNTSNPCKTALGN